MKVVGFDFGQTLAELDYSFIGKRLLEALTRTAVGRRRHEHRRRT